MKATRRQTLLGALALPASAAAPAWAPSPSGTITIYDPALVTPIDDAVAVTGDPVRFAQKLVARRPALIVGITRHADALLIAEVAQEAGYRSAATPANLGAHSWALAKTI